MATDIFNYQEGWEQKLIEEDEVIDLDEELEKQRQELLAQQWRDGELFVTTEYVVVYENPTDPSPVVCEFEPDTVILLASLKDSHNYGGFRDVLLPIRGWIWTSVDEYDRAFHDASMMLRNIPTRETSGSVMRLKKYGKKQLRKLKSKRGLKDKKTKGHRSDSHATKVRDPTDKVFDQVRDSRAFSEADAGLHQRNKTNHLYVSDKQRQLKYQQQAHQMQNSQLSALTTTVSLPSNTHTVDENEEVSPPPASTDTPVETATTGKYPETNLAVIHSGSPWDQAHHGAMDSFEPQESPDPSPATPPPPAQRAMAWGSSAGSDWEPSLDSMGSMGSKYRRMSHQVTYNAAAIKKVERPLSLEELDKLDENNIVGHIQVDSVGRIINDTTLKGEEKDEEKKQTNEQEGANVDTTLTDTEQEEKESLLSRIVNSRIVRRTIHFVRSHPALLTLLYILFTGFVEGIIFFDIITDVIVAGELAREAKHNPNYLFPFALSAVLIITPYFIAWSSVWGLIEKKREQVLNASKDKENKNNHLIFKNARRYRIFVYLFSFAPFGVIMLMLFDCWIVFEFACIRPLYFCCRFKLFRSDTFEELGYRKLRRVSEVCSETLFQALLQLYLLINYRISKARNEAAGEDAGEVSGVNPAGVSLSLLASSFVIFLWFGIILRIEASVNGISVIEYLPIVLQGSFKFVPFLPAIEKGTKNGKRVNWCLFKFDLNALSALGKALGSPQCDLQIIKVSTKTLKKLPRLGCKFFGRLMNTATGRPINVIISRLDRDLEDLFDLFDVQNTKYFNFTNFCRATLALRAQDNETLSYVEISKIFYELAAKKNKNDDFDIDDSQAELNNQDKNEQKVWLLDLTLKLRTSKEYISILDIAQPEDYSVKKNDVNMLTFCRSLGFQSIHHDENVVSAVCQNKLDIAHALTEDDGIPIVVEITEGMELLQTYLNFHQPAHMQRKNDENAEHHGVRTNLDVVQQYHKLNRERRMENKTASYTTLDPMSALNELFNDVSVYVSVAMCEIEKTTQTTKETLNQFWNERLLFIIPYSVVDEIRNDATHTLARDTEHNEHFPQFSTFYSHEPHISHYLTSHTTHRDLPPMKLPYNEESNSYARTPTGEQAAVMDHSHAVPTKHVTFAMVKNDASDIAKNTLIQEMADEDSNEEDGDKTIQVKHATINTTLIHSKNVSTTQPTYSHVQMQSVPSEEMDHELESQPEHQDHDIGFDLGLGLQLEPGYDDEVENENENEHSEQDAQQQQEEEEEQQSEQKTEEQQKQEDIVKALQEDIGGEDGHQYQDTIRVNPNIEQSANEKDHHDANTDDSHNEEEATRTHRTGLTAKLENILMPQANKETLGEMNINLQAEIVPDSSPNMSPEIDKKRENQLDQDQVELERQDVRESEIAQKHSRSNTLASQRPKPLRQQSSIDPDLFTGNNLLRGRGRESALRDSLHINKFGRQSSVGKMMGIPHFEKKIYLDFNLFDDSGVGANSGGGGHLSERSTDHNDTAWDFPNTQSTGSITAGNTTHRKIKRPLRTPSGVFRSGRNVLTKKKKPARQRSHDDALDYMSDDSLKSDDEEEKHPFPDVGTPRSKTDFVDVVTPRSPVGKTELNESSGIDGGEGTFLGSCHVSINIDDADALDTFHHQTLEKEIKIGKKSMFSDEDVKRSKLKFKVYCNALAAYLKHGKNYGDRLVEQDMFQPLPTMSKQKSDASS